MIIQNLHVVDEWWDLKEILFFVRQVKETDLLGMNNKRTEDERWGVTQTTVVFSSGFMKIIAKVRSIPTTKPPLVWTKKPFSVYIHRKFSGYFIQ
jgi:hypothetical protein